MNYRYLLISGFSAVLFVAGALVQGQKINWNMQSSDQSAYMHYAKSIRMSHFQHVGDRNRMPVYPGLMALFYRPGMSDDEYFAIGKRVGIALSFFVLIATFVVFSHYLRFTNAFTAIHVAAFTVFVYKAPYFQAEILFYGLSFWLFISIIELLRRPRLSAAFCCGIIGGIAQLTKASVLPGILLGLLWLLIGTVPLDVRPHRHPSIKRLQCAALVSGVFLAVVFPYIRTSKARFGHYFYNVNSTFYMWYDSFKEAEEGTKVHGDRVGWPDLSPEQIPSPRKYWREHSGMQIATRFLGGMNAIRRRAFHSYGYASFLVIYVSISAILIWQNRTCFIGAFCCQARSLPALFGLTYFSAYMALYAWYAPIAEGDRFVLALFLPALFCCAWVIDEAEKNGLSFRFYRYPVKASEAVAFIGMVLFAYIVFFFPHWIAILPGGGT